MKLVFISDSGSHHKKVTVNLLRHILFPLLVATILIAVIWMLASSTPQILSSKKDVKAYKNFNSVIHKLSSLDAEVQRLNALGAHIASKQKIDVKDFSLKKAPARGGVIRTDKNHFGSAIVRKSDINNSLKGIENNLEKQKLKLKNLVTSLEVKEAEEYLAKLTKNTNVIPKQKSSKGIQYDFSTPLKKGYISSPYGNRRDPINGSARHHSGLDIAAKKGTKVYAIANGFVTFKGIKGGYGNLLEINHSASLKSRYAHLDSFLVKKGQMVRKGDLIGRVGATGRVTGPHLHLEIRENNKVKNPKLYLKQALRRF